MTKNVRRITRFQRSLLLVSIFAAVTARVAAADAFTIDPTATVTFTPPILLVKIDKKTQKIADAYLTVNVSRKQDGMFCDKVRKVRLSIAPSSRFGEKLTGSTPAVLAKTFTNELGTNGLCNFGPTSFKISWQELQNLSGYNFHNGTSQLISTVCAAPPTSVKREHVFSWSTYLVYGSKISPSKDASTGQAGQRQTNYVLRYICE